LFNDAAPRSDPGRTFPAAGGPPAPGSATPQSVGVVSSRLSPACARSRRCSCDSWLGRTRQSRPCHLFRSTAASWRSARLRGTCRRSARRWRRAVRAQRCPPGRRAWAALSCADSWAAASPPRHGWWVVHRSGPRCTTGASGAEADRVREDPGLAFARGIERVVGFASTDVVG